MLNQIVAQHPPQVIFRLLMIFLEVLKVFSFSPHETAVSGPVVGGGSSPLNPHVLFDYNDSSTVGITRRPDKCLACVLLIYQDLLSAWLKSLAT